MVGVDRKDCVTVCVRLPAVLSACGGLPFCRSALYLRSPATVLSVRVCKQSGPRFPICGATRQTHYCGIARRSLSGL